jgi:hypothetical protein
MARWIINTSLEHSLSTMPNMAKIFFSFLAIISFFSIPVTGHALTADEIIRLKEKGVEDRTIQMLIEQENRKRERSPGVGVDERIRPDGGMDKTYYSITTPEESTTEKENIERARELLKNTIIDGRKR